jgi:hypothetical protein
MGESESLKRAHDQATETCAPLQERELLETAGTEPAAMHDLWKRLEAQSSLFPRSRRLHYLSMKWEDFGGPVRTVGDWITGGKRRRDNDL